MSITGAVSKYFSNSALAALLFFAVGTCLMGPLASDSNFPYSPDHANHTAAVIQGRLAIEEGQFPLRVAPWQHNGLRYPHFQFYSWLPFWIGGLLHKFVHPDNPWVALKSLYILAIGFSGTCMFAALRRLSLTRSASLAGSLVYVTAPYFLMNIYSRGAFTEAIAQAELPLALWGISNILRGSLRQATLGFASTSIAIYLLASTHIITFAYALLFIVIFLTLVTALRALPFTRVAVTLASLAAGCLLAAHQLIPIISTTSLQIRESLQSSPVAAQSLSPLSVVLSLGPSASYLATAYIPGFCPQVGLPVLVSACLALFVLLNGERKQIFHRVLLSSALFCLVLATLAASATIDIWRWLPQEFYVLQFPYRLLTFSAFFGAMVAGVAAQLAESRFTSAPMGVAGLALISAAIWQQPNMEKSGRTLAQVQAAPDLGYGSWGYLTSKAAVLPTESQTYIQGPLIFDDGWLNLGAKIRFSNTQLRETDGELTISGQQVPEAKGCQELHVLVGSNKIIVPTRFTAFSAVIPGRDLLQAAGNATNIEISFDSPCAFTPGPQDKRRLFMFATAFNYQRKGQSVRKAQAEKACSLRGDTLQCEFNSVSNTMAQLPMLFYPGFLEVTVNGATRSIKPEESDHLVVAAVEIPPGKSNVTARFVGSRLGNNISLGSFLCLALGAALFWRRSKD